MSKPLWDLTSPEFWLNYMKTLDFLRPNECRFPIKEIVIEEELQDRRLWLFCAAPAVLGKPYCEECAAIAHTRSLTKDEQRMIEASNADEVPSRGEAGPRSGLDGSGGSEVMTRASRFEML
jgi:hypothetical protein